MFYQRTFQEILLIYLLISVHMYILNLFTLPILVLISIIIILICLINRIWITILLLKTNVTEDKCPFLI